MDNPLSAAFKIIVAYILQPRVSALDQKFMQDNLRATQAPRSVSRTAMMAYFTDFNLRVTQSFYRDLNWRGTQSSQTSGDGEGSRSLHQFIENWT